MLFETLNRLTPFGPFGTVVLLAVIGLVVARRIIRKRAATTSGLKIREQLVTVIISLLTLLLIVLVLPISDSLRGQLLNLFGLALTAVVALSSTTVVANAMSGLMLRFSKTVRVGDLIQVGEHIGRVTSFGLFSMEIQTNQRTFVSLPNLHLINNPVESVHSSGTLMTATVTLGYDVHHDRVEELLVEAATATELEKPAVQIVALHDHAVEYKVLGFTADTSHLYTLKTQLHENVLDTLHEGGVEIVSPTFMNQRPQSDGRQSIPAPKRGKAKDQAARVNLEDIAFDKAAEAEKLETMAGELGAIDEEIKEWKDRLSAAQTDEEKEHAERKIAAKETRMERIRKLLESKSE